MAHITLSEAIQRIAAELGEAAARPRREAELMLMEHLGRDGLWLITHPEEEVDFDERLQNWVRRRQAFEPLEYIFNRVSFYSQHFFIEPGALIPRPETELLIDQALANIDKDAQITLCEVGVGSGAVSVILAQHLPHARILGVDISEMALNVAAKNIEAFDLEERIELRQSDVLDAVPESIDVLVSNPPYVAENAPVEPNLAYEPSTALYAGDKGMNVIVRLIDVVFRRRIPLFCCEMGYDQRDMVDARIPEGYRVQYYQDLAGLDRGFVMCRNDDKNKEKL